MRCRARPRRSQRRERNDSQLEVILRQIVQCAAVFLLVQTVGCSAQRQATSRVPYPATRTVDVVDDYSSREPVTRLHS